jgi:osomolarity two-component system, sensor histidine kinase TcsA
VLLETCQRENQSLLDTQGRVATWNAGAKNIKQYEPHEIIGLHFSTFYGKEDLEAQKPAKELEICLRDGRVEDEGWRYRKDGTRFWANVIITAVYEDGVHVGFSKVTRDLTERKAQETRLIAAYEESAKLKSDFLANMSHEIRTPMHGVVSACTLLKDTVLTEEQLDLVNIMDESGQVLLQVINDILDYSKLASGNFSINSDVVGISNIITSVVRTTQTTLSPAVHFELFMDPNLPNSVQGDPLRFRQVLQNLIGNAAKFTERGYVRVHCRAISQDDDNVTLLTEVIDTGIGVSDISADHLFTPFHQSDNSTKKRFKGTGLGLSISKSLAELMGGQIGFKPNPERQGSNFWFTANFLKIKSLEQITGFNDRLTTSMLSPSVTPPVVDPMDTLKVIAPKKRILLAEDNPTNQKVMLKMLRILGFAHIDTCTDGAQAVSAVLAKHNRPPGDYVSPNLAINNYDMILMDINMPFVDGHDATRQLREAGVRTPIIAMTAYALKGDREMCLEKGLDDYIPKPVERMALVKTLVKWLVRPQPARAGS